MIVISCLTNQSPQCIRGNPDVYTDGGSRWIHIRKPFECSWQTNSIILFLSLHGVLLSWQGKFRPPPKFFLDGDYEVVVKKNEWLEEKIL